MSLIKRPFIYIILLLLVQKKGSIMQKKLDNLKEKMTHMLLNKEYLKLRL